MSRIFHTLFLLIAVPVMTMAQNFRFAQITDIHLAQGAARQTEDLMTSINDINRTDGLDFVLITGDISDNGDQATMLEAKRCFDQLRYPYQIILGNHETTWSDSGCTAWSQIFGPEHFEMNHQGVHFLGFNTCPLNRMMYGHVDIETLRWLRERLESFSAQEPVIIVTHYPLLDGDVDNWYEVTDLLRHYNVRLVIGGHYHTLNRLSYDGLPGVLMRQNYRDGEGNVGYGVYEVTPDSIYVRVQNVGKSSEPLATFAMKGVIRDPEGKVLDPDGQASGKPDLEADNHQYPQVREQWMVQGPTGIYCSPAVMGHQCFVGDDQGVLTAYNLKNGKQQWSYRTRARIVGTPAADDGVVVTGSTDGQIYGLRARNGQLLWSVYCQAAVVGAVRIMNGRVYVGASDHRMRCLDLKTGRLIWEYTDVQGYIAARPLVTHEHVVFGAWDGHLYSLNTTDGTLQWKWTCPRPGMHYSPASVWPVETNGRIFIADPERALTAIDAHTGAQIWRTHQSTARETVEASADGERVYSKTMQDSVVCFSTQGAEARQLWASNVGFGYEIAPSMPQEKDGILYGSTMLGKLFALNPKTGELLWRHQVGHTLINTVVPLGKHRVLFTSASGQIGLLRF